MSVKEKDNIDDKLSGGQPISGWKLALLDARRKLGECQSRVRQLRRSVEIIEQKISEGEPWPGTQN